MMLVNRSVSIGCLLAVLAISGCQSADREDKMFPQTTETIVVDPAHAPQTGATVVKVYDDKLYGKTEVRSDDYIRHADTVSPTGWTPWHYRTYPHNWSMPMTYDSTVSGSWTAKVQVINLPHRLITLQGPSGKSETFTVGAQVQRLDEARVGDTVTLGWTATLHGELRSPTAEETADPIKVYTMISRASSDASPAGAEGLAMRVVTTIDAVDTAAMTVALKGPLGNRIVVHAKSAENIRKLKVGDTVMVTYSQGVAVSLTKAAP